MQTMKGRCKHKNTAAASAIRYASVWCPDCRKWVQLEKPKKVKDGSTK